MHWAERVLLFASGARPDDVLEQIVRERLPGSSGLVVSSALAGERSPDWLVDGRGFLAGLSLATGSIDILQGLVESAVVGLVRSVRELETWSGPLDLILSGGGARSLGWRRMIADGFGRAVLLSDVADTSLRGGALLCLERLGLLVPAEECRPALTLIEPDPVRSEAFARLVAASDLESAR
jgi:sugar (pentulose or hexulose) kinase